MDEIKFAVKAFLAALGIVFIFQLDIAGETIESKVQNWIETSETSEYLQQSAHGGALLIQKTTQESLKFIKEKISGQENRK